MAIHKSISELQLAVMEETLDAAYILLADENLTPPITLVNGKIANKCRYGYPAAILLFSFVDAVGLLYNEREGKSSFKILTKEIFCFQKIERRAYESLYNMFRSKLTHNLSLPENAFLIYSPKDPTAFISTSTASKVDYVNLHALYSLCFLAFHKLRENHNTTVEKSNAMKNISKSLLEIKELTVDVIGPSGFASF